MRLVVAFFLVVLMARSLDGGACPSLGCEHGPWSSWTRSTKPCEGTAYRRRLCGCPTGGCENGITDRECFSEPSTESRTYSEEVGCCNWGWASASLDYEPCNEQSCGIMGKKWRRQKCYCSSGNGLNVLTNDEHCAFRGPPQEESEDCMIPCCNVTERSECPGHLSEPLDECVREWSLSECTCQGGATPPIFSSSCQVEPFDLPHDISDPVKSCANATNHPDPVSCNVIRPDGSSDCFTYLPGGGIQAESCSSAFVVAPNCYLNTYYTTKCYGSCALDSTGVGKQWRIPHQDPTELCFYPPPAEVVECDLECCRLGEWSDWSICDNPNGPGTQWRRRACSCVEEGLCPFVPIEVRECNGTVSCTWKQDVHRTKCSGAPPGSLGVHYAIPTCHCDDSSSQLCDISNCIGPIPIKSFECTVPSCADCIWTEIPSPCNGSCLPSVPPYQDGNHDLKRNLQENDIIDGKNYDSSSDVQLPTTASGFVTVSHLCTCGGVISLDAACSTPKPTETYIPCTKDCPACGWRQWTDWNSCSRTCGGGMRSRDRPCNCSNPAVAYHSASAALFKRDILDDEISRSYCKGVGSQMQHCNTHDCPSPKLTSVWASAHSWPTGTENYPLPCTTNTWKQQISQRRNLWDLIAAEYITARLNIIFGVPPSILVNEALTAAITQLSDCYSEDWTSESFVGKSTKAYTTLQLFNRGEKGFLGYGLGDSNTYELLRSNELPSTPVAAIVAPSVISGVLLIVIVIGITHWYQKRRTVIIIRDGASPPGTPGKKV